MTSTCHGRAPSFASRARTSPSVRGTATSSLLPARLPPAPPPAPDMIHATSRRSEGRNRVSGAIARSSASSSWPCFRASRTAAASGARSSQVRWWGRGLPFGRSRAGHSSRGSASAARSSPIHSFAAPRRRRGNPFRAVSSLSVRGSFSAIRASTSWGRTDTGETSRSRAIRSRASHSSRPATSCSGRFSLPTPRIDRHFSPSSAACVPGAWARRTASDSWRSQSIRSSSARAVLKASESSTRSSTSKAA